jgi:hypothetical protein
MSTLIIVAMVVAVIVIDAADILSRLPRDAQAADAAASRQPGRRPASLPRAFGNRRSTMPSSRASLRMHIHPRAGSDTGSAATPGGLA